MRKLQEAQLRPRKHLDVVDEPSKFDEVTLFKLAEDLEKGRIPLPRVQVSDDIQTGLRAMVNKSGLITLHAAYTIGGSRPFIKIGELDKKSEEHITIAQARTLTKTIQALADKGIDVQEGLHRRLIRELKAQGTAWRPK